MAELTRRFVVDGLKLKNASSTLKKEPILGGLVVIEPLKPNSDRDYETILEITLKGSKTDIELRKESINLASRIITCFRLQQDEGIGYNREEKDGKTLPLTESPLPYRYPKEDSQKLYEFDVSKLNEIQTRAQDIEEFIGREAINNQTLFRCALA